MIKISAIKISEDHYAAVAIEYWDWNGSVKRGANKDRRSQISFLMEHQYEDFNASTVEVWKRAGKTDVSDLIACWLNVANPTVIDAPHGVYARIIDRLAVVENKKLLARAAIDTLKIAYPKTWPSKMKVIAKAVPGARDHLAAEAVKEELNGRR